MSLRLHWSPDSANLVIRMALEMLGLDFEAVRVNRGAAEHKTANYLKLNPQGLLPVLEDGDRAIFETGAILWHLAERAGRFGPEGPAFDNPAARSEALTWMFYLSNTLHADLRIAFYPHCYLHDPDEIERLRDGLGTRLSQHCDLIEAELGRGGLIGPAPTILDIYLVVCLRWAQIYPKPGRLISDLARWPRLFDLARRIEQGEAAQTAFVAEFIPAPHGLTSPVRPDLPRDEVTGSI